MEHSADCLRAASNASEITARSGEESVYNHEEQRVGCLLQSWATRGDVNCRGSGFTLPWDEWWGMY